MSDSARKVRRGPIALVMTSVLLFVGLIVSVSPGTNSAADEPGATTTDAAPPTTEPPRAHDGAPAADD